MNKISLPLSVIAILLCVFTIFNMQSSSEQVYVDVNKLIEGYDRTKNVRAEFETKAKTLNANVDSLMVDWQKELKAYEKERSKMTQKELELKQQLLNNKQQQLNNYQQVIQKQIQEEDQKASQTVVNDINDYVKYYGKKHNYKIIFGASGAGNIMYANDGADLTKVILEGLNAKYNGKVE
ncbi:OmpH family outer membrane protein [Pontimicrobium aquaticum]|uniref:OmpH family outer membrane protein n=2 Tax=Pontimicrobium aquaticum TaxID=2565367 RepID=A0A4U0F120_9FLAO|nr:OmpH family outer membrane protein [Pontimicrobium aquaticum]